MMNRRAEGEIGQTITWVFATIVIIVTFLIVVFAEINLSKVIGFINGQKGSYPEYQAIYLVSEKSFLSFLLTNNLEIYNQLKSEGNLNDNTGILAQDIFQKFYPATENLRIWIGTSGPTTITSGPTQIQHIPNKYFDISNLGGSKYNREVMIKLNGNFSASIRLIED